MHRSFLILLSAAIFIASCGGKNSSAPADSNDTLQAEKPDSATAANNEAKAVLTEVRPFLEKELGKWMQSFQGLHIDSLKQSQIGKYDMREAGGVDDSKEFFSLYGASLAYSPDSSQFIDLYSSGITLERNGKRIRAMADVDQGVTLCNLKTKECKGLVYFGPSAGIEEAVWTSPTQFLLAGFAHNDEGKFEPILLVGDTNNKSLRWYGASTIRSADYNSSSMEKLKIDDWE